jgi:hypothetical protein
MVRGRSCAVSNHEVQRISSSFETLLKKPLLRMRIF